MLTGSTEFNEMRRVLSLGVVQDVFLVAVAGVVVAALAVAVLEWLL